MIGTKTAQLARAIWNRAAIAVGTADHELALEVCRELGGIEADYTLVARDALMAGTARAETSGPANPAGAETRAPTSSLRHMPAKFPGICGQCGGHIQVGSPIAYDAASKRAYHEGCV
jgi:hypothetical protein